MMPLHSIPRGHQLVLGQTQCQRVPADALERGGQGRAATAQQLWEWGDPRRSRAEVGKHEDPKSSPDPPLPTSLADQLPILK